MKYYIYVYTKSGNLYKAGKEVDGIKFRNKELDDPKAIRKALDAFIQEVAGNEPHVHAFVSRHDYYSKANPLPIGDVIFYKKDGGRFTNRPALGSSTKNFYKALKEAWSWTPANEEDIKKYQDELCSILLASSTPKDNESKKINAEEKHSPQDVDIEKRFKNSTEASRKAFMSVLKIISHKNCNDENWLQIYSSLSAIRKDIVAATLK